ncbi:MAG: AIR synthase-related protein [Thermoanaerobaculia bacterium]
MEEHYTYKKSGVNIASGEEASKLLFEAAKKTWGNRRDKVGEIELIASHFRGCRFFSPFPGFCFGMNFDGIGTKIEVAERLNTHRGLARDLVAMTCDDAAVQGAEPILFGSIIDTARINTAVIAELAQGLIDAAAIANVAVINGELAELPGRVAGYGAAPLNWGGACLWCGRPETLSGWTKPIPGDVVVGLSENGFRSNGYSLLRAIFHDAFGETWGLSGNPSGIDLIRFAARPSTIYTPFLLSITGGLSGYLTEGLRAAIHITGGGLLGRCKEFCREQNLGMVLDSLPSPPEEMCQIRELGNVDLAEAYRTWNMGIGLLVVCSKNQATQIVEVASLAGMTAEVVGAITADDTVKLRTYVDSLICENI